MRSRGLWLSIVQRMACASIGCLRVLSNSDAGIIRSFFGSGREQHRRYDRRIWKIACDWPRRNGRGSGSVGLFPGWTRIPASALAVISRSMAA